VCRLSVKGAGGVVRGRATRTCMCVGVSFLHVFIDGIVCA